MPFHPQRVIIGIELFFSSSSTYMHLWSGVTTTSFIRSIFVATFWKLQTSIWIWMPYQALQPIFLDFSDYSGTFLVFSQLWCNFFLKMPNISIHWHFFKVHINRWEFSHAYIYPKGHYYWIRLINKYNMFRVFLIPYFQKNAISKQLIILLIQWFVAITLDNQ